MVIDCYRLADVYHQSPDVFLAMKLSDVELHLRRTVQLRKIQASERAASDDG